MSNPDVMTTSLGELDPELAEAMVGGHVDEARATAVLDVLDRVPAACSPEEHRAADY